MPRNNYTQPNESIVKKFQFGDITVLVTNKRVIVDENGTVNDILLDELTNIVVIDGSTYNQYRSKNLIYWSFRILLHKLRIKEKKYHPVEMKLQSSIPTTPEITFITTTKYKDKVVDLHRTLLNQTRMEVTT